MSDWEFRAAPRMLRRQAAIWTVVLGGGAVFGFYALPANVRALFTPLQIGTLAFFVLFMLGIVWVVALGYVWAGPQGLRFRNGLKTREVPWSEIAAFRYAPADHWAFVEFRDDTDRPLLGIQRSDGGYAEDDVAALRDLHAQYAE